MFQRGRCLLFAAVALTVAAAPVLAQGMPEMGQPKEMKTIQKMAGHFTCEFKYKMDPAGEWMTTTAEAEIENRLDGCVQFMLFSGNFGDMPMEGVSLTSYSRERGKWQMTWVDNMAASLSYAEGDMKDGKMVLVGKDMSMGQEMWMRYSTYDITDNSWKWTMEMSMDGKEYMPMGEAVYTRAGTGGNAAEKDEGGW